MSHNFSLMLAVHDAVRRDLIRFVTRLGGTAPVGTSQAAALGSQWELVVGRVVEHEQIEDEVLWPAVRVAVPAEEQAPLDRMAEQHEQLTRVLGLVSARFADGALVSGGAARADLADRIERAAVMADAQFAYEERNVLPLLERWLTATQWAAFVAAQQAPAGPLQDPVVLPWLLEGSRPERALVVLGLLGDEHRRAYEQNWKPAHHRRVAEVW
jgi:hypothetical protein